jgi:hypothetical protein
VVTKQIRLDIIFYILLFFLHNVILFYFLLKIIVRMNVIPFGTARGEYEIQVLGKRIESEGYGSFKYIVTIPNEQCTRDDT